MQNEGGRKRTVWWAKEGAGDTHKWVSVKPDGTEEVIALNNQPIPLLKIVVVVWCVRDITVGNLIMMGVYTDC